MLINIFKKSFKKVLTNHFRKVIINTEVEGTQKAFRVSY